MNSANETAPNLSQTPAGSPSSGALPSGGETSTTAKSSLKGAGLRYTADDGVPTWAVGKTADEILNIASQAVNYLQTSPQPQAVAAPSPAPAQNTVPSAPPAELAYQDPTAWARQYDEYQRWQLSNSLNAYAAPVMAQMSELARAQSQNGQHADVWKRWGPEIELKIASIPREQRTIMLYDQAAALVKADHVEEIARERAEQLAGTSFGAGTERSPSSAVGSNTAASDPLEAAFAGDHPFFAKARAEGLTPARVRTFLEQTGRTVEDYIASATRGSVVVNPAGFVRAHG